MDMGTLVTSVISLLEWEKLSFNAVNEHNAHYQKT